ADADPGLPPREARHRDEHGPHLHLQGRAGQEGQGQGEGGPEEARTQARPGVGAGGPRTPRRSQAGRGHQPGRPPGGEGPAGAAGAGPTPRADRPAGEVTEAPPWQAAGRGKQPFRFRLADGRPFAFAGLWERWDRGGEPVESCTILTTAANAVVRPVHDPLPVLLRPGDFAAWLDPLGSPAGLQALLRPYPAEGMEARAVSRRVNSPRNEGPECWRRRDDGSGNPRRR